MTDPTGPTDPLPAGAGLDPAHLPAHHYDFDNADVPPDRAEDDIEGEQPAPRATI